MSTIKSITIEVKDKDGKKHTAKIKVDEKECTAIIEVDKKKKFTKLKKSEDGKQITGKTSFLWIEYTVTITISCETKPPTLKIVVKKKNGDEVKPEVYTFTHEEQNRLVDWINNLDLSKRGTWLCNLNKSDKSRKPEFHNLANTKPECQIDEIKNYEYAATKQAAKDAGYDPCAHCMPGESTK